MRDFKKFLLVPAAIVMAACGRSDAPKADDGLKSDLALASQVQPSQQYVSPQELGYGQAPGAVNPYGYPQQYAQAPAGYYAPAPAPAPVRRTSTSSSSTRRRSSSSSGGSYGRSSGTYQEPVYRQPTTVKHTKRDAAIGAGAGAVIGAVTSRDKVKGAVIGGVAGAILGGVIGNNVDVQKKY